MPVAYERFNKMPWDQPNELPAIVVRAVGTKVEDKNGAPKSALVGKSVRTAFANRTAPSMLISPVPCSSMFEPLSFCAVYIRIILIMFGVSFELTWSKRAAAPATIGVAIEVPFRIISLRRLLLVTLASSSGCWVTIRLFAASA